MEGIVIMQDIQSLESMILQVQAGNRDLRDQFIESHIPLIKRAVRHFTRRYTVEHLDEYSIALQAFDEALSQYRTGSEMSFENFARLLIRRRLIDWVRKQQRNAPTVSLSDDNSENGLTLSEKIAAADPNMIQNDLELTESVENLSQQLKRFNLRLATLVRRFPKHHQSKLMCIRIARELTNDADLLDRLIETKHLPGKQLAERCQIPVKTIEKNRSNIIFLALLMQSDLPQLKHYLAAYERANRHE